MTHSTTLKERWLVLEEKLNKRFGKTPDLEAVLFLIGIQELGMSHIKFSKEQKQDLMHIATCTVLAASGYYSLVEKDEEGWPHFIQIKKLPEMLANDQENFLKDHILLYFQINSL